MIYTEFDPRESGGGGEWGIFGANVQPTGCMAPLCVYCVCVCVCVKTCKRKRVKYSRVYLNCCTAFTLTIRAKDR
jgi:hypothetical protein